jgi:hypothetical protein
MHQDNKLLTYIMHQDDKLLPFDLSTFQSITITLVHARSMNYKREIPDLQYLFESKCGSARVLLFCIIPPIAPAEIGSCQVSQMQGFEPAHTNSRCFQITVLKYFQLNTPRKGKVHWQHCTYMWR